MGGGLDIRAAQVYKEIGSTRAERKFHPNRTKIPRLWSRMLGMFLMRFQKHPSLIQTQEKTLPNDVASIFEDTGRIETYHRRTFKTLKIALAVWRRRADVNEFHH